MVNTRIVLWAFVLLIISSVYPEEKLFWHPVRLDKDGKLLAWSDSKSPYNEVVCLAWDAFKKIPVQPNGYKTYFAYPVFYGPKDTGQELFAGRDWTHNPGSLFAMLTDAAMLYYPYSGDEDIMPLIRQMLDHFIARGSTKESDAWSMVPYASATGGSLDYRGADDRRYVYGEEYLGRGDGIGFIEPDKVGELGLAYLRFYQYSLEEKYFTAAQRCADALVKHIRPSDESHSPWPFRVDAQTGTKMREDYTSNAVGPIRLLDEMIRLGRGNVADYKSAHDMAFKWLMKYPVQNNIWTQYFEDIYIYPDYRTNLNQYCPLETARYLMEHPEYDPQWQTNVKNILEWVRGFFAADSTTMAGLPEKGIQWGAEVISEQVNDMDKMTSHTARYASVLALWHELTGDEQVKERAFRSFNWASYGCKEDGLVKTSLDEGTGYWFSDGYGDYMRHFSRGMASVPQWAPANEDHMLRSSSIVRKIRYEKDKIAYTTFDKKSTELFKLTCRPKVITASGKKISECENLTKEADGYTVKPVDGGGFAVRIQHINSGDITILMDNFSISAHEMLLEPKHIYNFSGTLTVRPDVQKFGFGDYFSPPYFANPFQAAWKYSDQTISVVSYTWYPWQTITKGHLTNNILLSQYLIPLYGQRAFVCKLIVENKGTADFSNILSLEMKGSPEKSENWGWVRPRSPDNHTTTFDVHQKTIVLASKNAEIAAVFNPEPVGIDQNTQSISFSIDLKPAETREIVLIIGIGDKEATARNAQSLLPDIENDITESAQAWETKLSDLQNRLPRLRTNNQDLQRFYQRGLLTFLTTQWELKDAVFYPWYSESGIDGGAVCNYLWGDAYISKFLSLADPAATRALLLTSMRADYSSHYAIDFQQGNGLGVGYSYDYYSMALLAYDYVAITGDVSVLEETIHGKPFIDVLYAYVFEREDITQPPVLIDYGKNENMLELHRTTAYEHYTPSPNLERILSYQMMDQMFHWAGRINPVDFKKRAEQLQQVILDSLWDENLKWFRCLDQNKQPQVCYSIQIFDMLRAGVLSHEQAESLVEHLNEQEFLSAWGVHSLSKKDSGYDMGDADWGGPGVYAGDAPELIMDLLHAGFTQEGIDVLNRILWWEQLPYIPQALRADVRDYRRDGRGNVIAALAGPQAIVWGLFGIHVDGKTISIDPIENSYIAGLSVENIIIRGRNIQISINPDAKGYSVVVDGEKTHNQIGQAYKIPLVLLGKCN